jgi:hypothetical protein
LASTIASVRAPPDLISAPPFPLGLEWVGSRPLHVHRLRGHPVLVEFWDFCRPNSIRTLPYIKAWHERYSPAGLTVIGVHSPGFLPSSDAASVRAAVERLEIPYAVVVDSELEIWQLYGNLGWPARYLWNAEGKLEYYHYGEGAYAETEREIQRLCRVDGAVLAPMRPEDAPDAAVTPQTEDVAGTYSGPYEAGGVWAVLEGQGIATVNGRSLVVDGPGCYELISHRRSTRGRLELELSDGLYCHAVCFTPGLA